MIFDKEKSRRAAISVNAYIYVLLEEGLKACDFFFRGLYSTIRLAQKGNTMKAASKRRVQVLWWKEGVYIRRRSRDPLLKERAAVLGGRKSEVITVAKRLKSYCSYLLSSLLGEGETALQSISEAREKKAGPSIP